MNGHLISAPNGPSASVPSPSGLHPTVTPSISRVTNPQGLHARPADLFVKCALQYVAKIEIIKENERFDGKSILDILALAAVQGTELQIEAVGSDAEAALKALTRLFERDFAEEENLSKPEGGLNGA